ncbi:MAG: redoxin domain-containing protein [Planctomycetes bacterium]|nr:redoxin domain-containing protein [Planctomycetota bacterium]
MRAVAWLGVLLGLSALNAQEPPAPKPAPKPETPSVGTKVGELIPAFELATRDLKQDDGAPKTVSSRDAGKLRLYVSMSTNCPGVASHVERLKQLDLDLTKQGVEVLFVYPNYTEKLPAKEKFHKENGFAARFAEDVDAQVFGGKLKAKKTCEAVLVDAQGVIRYRGGIDDSPGKPKEVKRRYVVEAVEAVKAGKVYEGPFPPAPG